MIIIIVSFVLLTHEIDFFCSALLLRVGVWHFFFSRRKPATSHTTHGLDSDDSSNVCLLCAIMLGSARAREKNLHFENWFSLFFCFTHMSGWHGGSTTWLEIIYGIVKLSKHWTKDIKCEEFYVSPLFFPWCLRIKSIAAFFRRLNSTEEKKFNEKKMSTKREKSHDIINWLFS